MHTSCRSSGDCRNSATRSGFLFRRSIVSNSSFSRFVNHRAKKNIFTRGFTDSALKSLPLIGGTVCVPFFATNNLTKHRIRRVYGKVQLPRPSNAVGCKQRAGGDTASTHPDLAQKRIVRTTGSDLVEQPLPRDSASKQATPLLHLPILLKIRRARRGFPQ